jgi:DNA-binding ferritin-like protein (Dps family)
MELTDGQISAIKRAKQVAQDLVKKYKEIANLYRDGCTQREIAEQLDIAEVYGIRPSIAAQAVGYAIRGDKKEPFIDALINDENELERLCREHQGNGFSGNDPSVYKEWGSRGGKRSYKRGVGIFAGDEEERSRTAKRGSAAGSAKGGKKGGMTTYNKGAGIFAMTLQQQIDRTLKSITSRGLTPWSPRYVPDEPYPENAYCTLSEEEYCYMLAMHPNNRRGTRPSWKKVSHALNLAYHDGEAVRTPRAVEKKMLKYTRMQGLPLELNPCRH